MSERYLAPIIRSDALKDHKMAFISGPRQVGKTTLAKGLLEGPRNYFNWDETPFKKKWIRDPLTILQDIGPGPIVLGELHKYRFWKRSLKGLYDRVGKEVPMIVTGSARLDLFKKGGDSLLGRYLPYRLHPFSVAEEASHLPDPDQLEPRTVRFPLQDLMQLSGFPDPLLSGSLEKARRWSRLRLDQLVREDIRDFRNIRDVELMKLLVELLPDRLGSPLSINSLREDLQVAYATVRDWMSVLRNLFVCFMVPPYSGKIARSLVKGPKMYLMDWTTIENDGARLENVVAVHLLKACDYWTDIGKGLFELRYIRTKDKHEVDFCVLRDRKPLWLIECKSNETDISPALLHMSKRFPRAHAFQLTTQDVDRMSPGTSIRLMNAEKFLSMLV
jgi:predicted AAA+ superfamily ATPase